MTDTKAPDLFQRLLAFMREADEWGTPADVLRSAEDAGLAIVTEADKRVLEAMRNATDKDLARGHRGDWTSPVLTAERARRNGT